MEKPIMLIFGAGNIGRGFIGQVFCQNNYEVVFVDADLELIAEINRKSFYPLELVTTDSVEILQIGPVRACSVRDQAQVSELVSQADIMATAVGVPILPLIAPVIAEGLLARQDAGNINKVDVLVCENKIEAGNYLKTLIIEEKPELEIVIKDRIGFVDTSIGRMVPVLSKEDKAEDFLLIRSEPYDELPVDADGFKAEIPKISNLKAFKPFHFYHERKLFIHNMGHASAAYLGYLANCDTVADAVEKSEIRIFVEAAMRQVGRKLAEIYQVDYILLEEHIQDLLGRFANRRLGDTVARVGRDPLRKTEKNDRLAGAIRLLLEHNENPVYQSLALAAALFFEPDGDPTAQEVRGLINDQGLDCFLQEHCGLKDDLIYSEVRTLIKTQYMFIKAIK